MKRSGVKRYALVQLQIEFSPSVAAAAAAVVAATTTLSGKCRRRWEGGQEWKTKRKFKCLLFIFALRSNANHLVGFCKLTI